MSSPRRRLFPRYTALLTTAAALAGGLGAIYINLTETKFFESTAVWHSRPPENRTAAFPIDSWIAADVAAMSTPDTLTRVARRLNLETEWRMSAAECAEKLRRMITVEAREGLLLIRVTAQSVMASQSADIVNAVMDARGEEEEEKLHPARAAQDAELKARVAALDLSCVKKRLALVDALDAAHLLPEFNSESALKALTLSGDLQKQRDAWVAETVQLAEVRAALEVLATPAAAPPRGRIVQKGVPATTPVDTGFRQRPVLGTVGGAAAGLLLSMLFGRFGKPRPEPSATPSGALPP